MGAEVVKDFYGQTYYSKGQERDEERGGEKQRRVNSGVNFHL